MALTGCYPSTLRFSLESSMKDLVQLACDVARTKGASYADARVVYLKAQHLNVRNNELKSIGQSEQIGIGVRVISNGSWGFAATDRLANDSIIDCVSKAIKIAKASSALKAYDIRLATEPAHIAEWASPCKVDPFEVSTEEKVQYMFKLDDALRGVKGVSLTDVNMVFIQEEKYFANTNGSLISQRRSLTGAGFVAGAFKKGDCQYRSYPTSFGGQFMLAGYELIDQLDLVRHAVPMAEQAVELLSADECPSDEMDVILDADQLALQIHESIGHPTELDRVLGTEANFAGMSFLTPDKLNDFRYGSDKMNIVADARIEHGPSLGCFGYDDEGVAAQKIDIVVDGQFKGFLSSRETASEIGLARSGGCMRAESWNNIPLIRMTQISILPGEWNLEALIQDTKKGIFMTTNKSYSIDDKRLNFQFSCELGWLIEDGKRVKLIKNPSYHGITPVFWGSLDAICNKNHWILWGLPNCGKGQPMQSMGVSHGASPARFRNVKVGVAKS